MTTSILLPQIHESAAHLLFANEDEPDDPEFGRYFGFVSQFDRSFDLADRFATFEAAGETWQFNHNPADDGPSINYWKGKIRADDQDYDAFYEYNIPLVATDDTGEKKSTSSSDQPFPGQSTSTPATGSNQCPKTSLTGYGSKFKVPTSILTPTYQSFGRCFENSVSIQRTSMTCTRTAGSPDSRYTSASIET